MIRQYELVDIVKGYDPEADEALLNKAYVYSMKAHGSQTRHSGDPYFSHPLEVAGILTDLKLDTATIVTALLHDTVEDTSSTLTEIDDAFGENVAALVDGVTKLTRLELSSEETSQAENFRKLMVAMSRDVRVLLVKMADRLHNMRTLHHHPKEASRKRIALETLEIYAPLAGRMGMQDFRDELEDLAFATLNPDQRETIINRLNFLSDSKEDLVETISARVADVLKTHGIKAEVMGRRKRPFSTWRKLQRKEISFEQLSDVMGFRIVVDEVDECYRALGVLHQEWQIVPGRFKDYISTPKNNGYQSVHTTVIGPEQQRVEVQIRTRDMHEIAELGVAAHWLYKEAQRAGNGEASRATSNPYGFLSHIRELLEHSDSPQEFLEHTKLEMFLDQVFCFTPKGELIALPRGATPIDFAYAVHTRIGDTCVGAKVDGVNVGLDVQLNNGDSVEILRSDAQRPDPNWQKFVATGKARSAVRRFIRETERQEFVSLGKGLIERVFREEDQMLTDKGLEFAAKRLNLETAEDVYYEAGASHLTGHDVLFAVYPGTKPKARRASRGFILRRPKKTNTPFPIRGLTPGLTVHLSDCCSPIPGDRIVGITEPGIGIHVHTIDCSKLEQYQEQMDRWIDISWEPDASASGRMVGRIRVSLNHEIGALGALCTKIADDGGNITNIRATRRQPHLVEFLVDIEVDDVKHLTNITAALRANPYVNAVRRVRGS